MHSELSTLRLGPSGAHSQPHHLCASRVAWRCSKQAFGEFSCSGIRLPPGASHLLSQWPTSHGAALRFGKPQGVGSL